MSIWQLDTLGNKVYGYNLENVFITGIGEVSYSDSELDSLVEYTLTFTFSEFYPISPNIFENKSGITNTVLRTTHKGISELTSGLF